jgi:hypothetical protein
MTSEESQGKNTKANLLVLLSDVSVITDDGTSHCVPIKDYETKPVEIDKENFAALPCMILHHTDDKKFHLHIVSDTIEHIYQMTEQITTKFGYTGRNEAAGVKLTAYSPPTKDKKEVQFFIEPI